MSIVRQVIAVTGMNLLSIGQRASSSLVVVVGIAGVVGVLVSVDSRFMPVTAIT